MGEVVELKTQPMKMSRANSKNCYCHTCKKSFHYLGIARHRAMHRNKKETCIISYTKGNTYEHKNGERYGLFYDLERRNL